MITTIYLTEKERQAFEALPDGLRAGWTVAPETLEQYEDALELKIRMRLARFTDVNCQKLLESLRTAETKEAFAEAVQSCDLSDVPQDQLAELFFAVGARVPSQIIRLWLPRVESDEDVESIAAFSQIRHMLFETNASPAA